MTKPNDPSAPIYLQHGLTNDCHVDSGLTKREYFAAMAMQGLTTRQSFPERVANDAVQMADALIKALNQTPTPSINQKNKEG